MVGRNHEPGADFGIFRPGEVDRHAQRIAYQRHLAQGGEEGIVTSSEGSLKRKR